MRELAPNRYFMKFKISINSKERDDRKTVKDELDQAQTRISKARELLLGDDLDAADYKKIKQEGDGKIRTDGIRPK